MPLGQNPAGAITVSIMPPRVLASGPKACGGNDILCGNFISINKLIRYEFYLLVLKVSLRHSFPSLICERYLEHYLLGLSSRHFRVSFWENTDVNFGWVAQLWKWLPYLFSLSRVSAVFWRSIVDGRTNPKNHKWGKCARNRSQYQKIC